MRWVVLVIIVFLLVPGVIAASGTISASPNPCKITEPGSTCSTQMTWESTGTGGMDINTIDTGIFVQNPDTLVWGNNFFSGLPNAADSGPGFNQPVPWIKLQGTNFVFYSGCSGIRNDPTSWWVPDRSTCATPPLNTVLVRAECESPLIPDTANAQCVCPTNTFWDGVSQCTPCLNECATGATTCTNGVKKSCRDHVVCGRVWDTPITCTGSCNGDVCQEDTTTNFDTSNFRAFYANTLISLAGKSSNNYVVDCGSPDVVNSNDTFFTFILDQPVCTLRIDAEFKGVMFSEGTKSPTEIINHLADYGDSRSRNNLVFKLTDASSPLCDTQVPIGTGGWFECENHPVKSSKRTDLKINVYMQQTNPVSYFVTYNYPNPFTSTPIESFLNFFRRLFGISKEKATTEQFTGFTKGYFSNITDSSGNHRSVNAVYNNYTSPVSGNATIVFKNFVLNVSKLVSLSLTPPTVTYSLGSDNRQVLEFDAITPSQWLHLTAALRTTIISGTLIEGSVCSGDGTGTVDYGEDCELTSSTDTAAFNSPSQSCADINSGQGTLRCTNTCAFDTTNCVSCVDSDGDGYSTSEGQPEELRAINTPIIGAVAIGSYEATDTAASGERSAVNIAAQIIPFPFGAFENDNGLANKIIAEAAKQKLTFPTCLLSKTEGECYTDAFSDMRPIEIALRAAVTAKTLSSASTLFKTISPKILSDNAIPPLETGSYGFFGSSYDAFFTQAAAEGITPVIVIDPGQFYDNFVISGRPNYEARLQTAITCAAIGRVLGPAHYIYLDVFRTDSEDYFEGYQSCRTGIINASAGLLYYNAHRTEDYALLNASAAPHLVDGLVTSDPEAFVTSTASVNLRELRQTMGAKLIVESAVNGTISALRASPEIVLYRGDVNELFIVNEILSSLRKPYAAATDSLTQALVDNGTPTTVFLQSDFTSTALPFDFTSCADVIVEENKNGRFSTEGKQLRTFDNGVPMGMYRFNVTDWSCFLKDTTIGTCDGALKPLDCNDSNVAINPSASEICDDGVDNDCDGVIDEAVSDNNCGALSARDNCVNDGFCDLATEDPLSCADCTRQCPIGPTTPFTQGEYEFSVSIDATGVPKLHFVKQPGSCPSLLESEMLFNPTAEITARGGILYDNKTIFSSEGTTVTVQSTTQGWSLIYKDSGSSTANNCWNNNGDGPFRSIKPLDHASCQYDGCNVVNQCPEISTTVRNVCVDINQKNLIHACFSFSTPLSEQCRFSYDSAQTNYYGVHCP